MTDYDETTQREILMASPHKVEQRRSLEGVRLDWRRATGSTGTLALMFTGGVLAGMASIGAVIPLLIAGEFGYGAGAGLLGLAAASALVWGTFRRPRASVELTAAGVRVGDGPLVPYGERVAFEFLIHDGSGVARASREVMEANRTTATKGATSSGVDVLVDGRRIPVARRVSADQALVLVDAMEQNWPPGRDPSVAEDRDAELDELERLRRGVRAAER